jgi:uncharacterized protein (DUF2147 family)
MMRKQKDGNQSMKFATAAAFGAALMSSAALAGTPEGTWLSEDGGTKVKIINCGGKLCGTVVWLDEPNDRKTGKPKTDQRNPDPAKRARPLLGLQVVNGMTPSGPDRWSGIIYNADDGHIYKARLKVKDSRTAILKGCVLMVLCRIHTWTRTN